MKKIIAKPMRFDNRCGNQKGIAILLSLLVLVLLVMLIMDFDFDTRADLRAAGNFRDEQKAYLLAQSAVNAARAVLRDDATHNTTSTALTAFWATPFPPYPLGDGILSGAITDEAGKFNLNQLVSSSTGRIEQPPTHYDILKRLFTLLNVDPGKVDAIVDWVDADSFPMPQGAEEGYYQSLNPPYHCKNGPMDTLTELHRVKGFDDDTYNKVAPYLTVYPTAGINVNTASPLLIQALDEGIDESTANLLVANRPFPDLQHFEQTLNKATVANAIQGLISFKSQIFSIRAEGKVSDTVKRIDAVVLRSGTNLPFLYYRIE